MDTSAMDDEEDDDDEIEHFTYDEEQVGDSVLSSVGLLGGENPEGEANSGSCQGGPFSALTRSMWPSKGLKSSELDGNDVIVSSSAHCDASPGRDTEAVCDEFDEFGFKVDIEDGPEQSSSKLLSTPFQDNPQQRLKWLAHLEFAQTSSSPLPKKTTSKDDSCSTLTKKSGNQSDTSNRRKGPLAWDTMVEGITRTHKLRSMVKDGIPHSLRPYVWLRLAGAMLKKNTSEVTYKQIVRASSNDHLMTSRQIEKDLLRTIPGHICFNNKRATGVPRMRRILRGLAWLYPDIGYCQGMGMIVATLLLIMEEEDTFWMMVGIIEDYLPPSYYSPSLIGVQADQFVLRGLLASHLPALDTLLQEHDIELSLITLNWFLTLYSSVLHIRIIMRLWDLFLFDGSRILFQVAIAMLKLHEDELLKADNSAEIFNILSTIPSRIDDIDSLMEAVEATASITDVIIEDNRRRHVTLLLSERGSWNHNLDSTDSKLHAKEVGSYRGRLLKRTIKRSKSVMGIFVSSKSSSSNFDTYKAKNIKQTEVMISLRDAILRVANYFYTADPNCMPDDPDFADELQADYSAESHARDHEIYMSISRSKRKRARAILDFERREDDELGFRKNDLITIISQKDDHCWIGELNGLHGWFPAKLVEVLDERSKEYSFAGDDSVTQAITDLVRGVLCPAVKRIFEHGLRRSTLSMGPVHPWQFVEEAASKEVEKDFKSVFSRLVLCKTFRLNEDGKVLSPEELLFRCVEAVNFTHNPKHAQMDVKLRSLICLGLNEQVLHLWLEALASNEEVVKKWYHPWSYMSSPGWVQIKCELRLLSKFSFNLNADWELQNIQDENKPLQDGVKDMLVTHHLFSWDL